MNENDNKNVKDSIKEVTDKLKNISADEAKEMANEKINNFKKLEPKKQALYVGIAVVILIVFLSMFSSKSAIGHLEDLSDKRFECYKIKYIGKKTKDRDDKNDLKEEYQSCQKELSKIQLELKYFDGDLNEKSFRHAAKSLDKEFKQKVQELKHSY